MSPAPTTRQLRLLEEIRAGLSAPLAPGEVQVVTRWQHWEDEELGFSPLGKQAKLVVVGAPFSLHIVTAWEESPRHIEATVHCYDTGRYDSGPWAILITADVRRAFAAIGFEYRQTQSFIALWADTTPAEVIVRRIERAAEIPVRILRPIDLPLAVDPRLHHWVVGLLGADALIERTHKGGQAELMLKSDDGYQTICIRDPEVAQFVRRWYANMGRYRGEST